MPGRRHPRCRGHRPLSSGDHLKVGVCPRPVVDVSGSASLPGQIGAPSPSERAGCRTLPGVSTSTSAERRFQDVFDSCASLVHAYALRHTDPESAQDVVSDVFLVAWRRMDQLPAEPLAWLLVVARNTLANSRRSATRRGQLERRLAAAAGHGTTATAQPVGAMCWRRRRPGQRGRQSTTIGKTSSR